MLNRPGFLRYFLPAAAGLLMLNACGFPLMSPSDQDQTTKLDQFIAEGGYKLARRFEIESFNETWWHDGQAIQISLLAPAEPGNYPVIVYLPGLGETADGGRLWREQWAKAGYLVFSVQPEAVAEAFADLKQAMPDKADEEASPIWEDDAETAESFKLFKGDERRPSRLLRASELRYIGREYFAAKSLENRIGHVLWAYTQCRQRSQARQGIFAKADSAQLLLAGYDLGAQAVSALIGENTDIVIPVIADFKPQAALVISPFVDASAGKLQERYWKITLPFLAVTAEEDKDPYGITTPKLRPAIWEYSDSAVKYLLLLKQADHRLLAGSNWSERPSEKARHADADGLMPDFADHPRKGSRRNGETADGEMGMQRGRFFGAEDRIPIHQQVAAVVGISTAFFDSIAKADNFAVLWLSQKAQPWLKGIGHLNNKPRKIIGSHENHEKASDSYHSKELHRTGESTSSITQ